MTPIVLDASALLALLRDEPGAERVRTVIDGAIIGAVNFAEVVSHYAKLGASRADIEAMVRPLPIEVEQADSNLALSAGLLRPLTLPSGLSLGDRFCLALAQRRGAAVLTADRRWLDVAERIGVVVESIR